MQVTFCNVQLLPLDISGGNCERANYIGEALVKSDIIALCEAFDNTAMQMIKADLSRDGYDNQFASHGLFIATKEPFKNPTYTCFKDSGSGWDRIVKKGFISCKMMNGIIVVVTHLQSGESDSEKNIKNKQLQQIESFIGNQRAIVSGDFNMEQKSDLPIARSWNAKNPLRDRTGNSKNMPIKCRLALAKGEPCKNCCLFIDRPQYDHTVGYNGVKVVSQTAKPLQSPIPITFPLFGTNDFRQSSPQHITTNFLSDHDSLVAQVSLTK
jgi:hypothetical protein